MKFFILNFCGRDLRSSLFDITTSMRKVFLKKEFAVLRSYGLGAEGFGGFIAELSFSWITLFLICLKYFVAV